MNARTGRIAAGLSAVVLLAATPAAAKDYGRVAPSQPEAHMPGVIAPSKAVPTAPGKQSLPIIKGLHFVDSTARVEPNGVAIPGITAMADLPLLAGAKIRSRLAAFLDKPLRQGDLSRISNVVVAWYRAHDLPVVRVSFPQQDVTSGTIQAVVTVYRLGKVTVTGDKYFSGDVLKSEMQLKPGRKINVARLKRDLNRLDRNPFRSVDAVLERSKTPGRTDLALHVKDRSPLSVYAGYDNDGQPVTGRDEYSIGFNWGNLFGLDQQLSYRFTTSPDLWGSRDRGAGHSDAPRLMAHSLDYLAPLPRGDFLHLFGSYTQQVPDLGTNFDEVGHSLQLSLRYEKDLPDLGPMAQQFQVGFDYKRSDNNLAFGGTSVFASATDIDQFLLLYGGSMLDPYGQTAFTNRLVASPGHLSSGNTDQVFQASGVAGASASYVYDNLQVTRLFALPAAMRAIIRLGGQLASSELLPSEQLGLGGTGSVRGYDPRVANGSQGILASFELHAPVFHPLRHLGAAVHDNADLYAFFDLGRVSYRNAQQNLPRSTTLDSIGLGFNYTISHYLTARFDYGWQLAKAPGASSTSSFANIAVTLSY